MIHRGIFGGTFDPPHFGHISLAEKMANKIPLDIVHWVPARTPPHKPAELLSPTEHRVAMVELIIKNNPKWEICRFELEPDNPPWTVYTIERFHREFPDDRLHLLIGGDSLTELNTWRDFRRLWTLAEIDIAVRPGWSFERVDEEILANVRIVSCPEVDISSTQIRSAVRRGEPICGLLPKEVEEYIVAHGLYL